MNYIQNKLDEFPYYLGSDEMTKQTKDWIEQAFTDYHNHIVEKFKEKYKFSSSTKLFEILSILQDTNPKE